MNSTSFINKPSTFVGGQSFNILIQEYFVSEEWEWIYQFSLQKNTTEEKLSRIKFSLNVIWINYPISFCGFVIFLVYETLSHGK